MIFERAKGKYGIKTGNINGESIRAERPFIQKEPHLIEYFDVDGVRMYKTPDGKKHFVADIYDKIFNTQKLEILPKKLSNDLLTDVVGVKYNKGSIRSQARFEDGKRKWQKSIE